MAALFEYLGKDENQIAQMIFTDWAKTQLVLPAGLEPTLPPRRAASYQLKDESMQGTQALWLCPRCRVFVVAVPTSAMEVLSPDFKPHLPTQPADVF